MKRVVELVLMAVGSFLLAAVQWLRWPGNVWGAIGLALVPVCLLLLLGVVVWEYRVGEVG